MILLLEAPAPTRAEASDWNEVLSWAYNFIIDISVNFTHANAAP